MKKVLIVACIFATTLTSFSLSKTKSKEAVMKKATLTIVEEDKSTNSQTAYAVSRSILEGNWEKLDSLLDDNFTYTGDGYHFSKDQYIGFMQEMRGAFSNFEMILEQTIAENDMVSIRFTSNVINTGKFMGAPNNNKNIVVSGIFMRKIENGKVMQEWQTTDLLGTMNQIGFGAMFGYSLFVTGFKVKQAPPVRKPNDFLHVQSKVENFDILSGKEKNKYLKTYLKTFKSQK
jgi:predicted ester cyclase